MTKKLKILVLADGVGPTAARGTDVIYETICELARLGAEVTLLTTKDYFTNREKWNTWREGAKTGGVTVEVLDLGLLARFVHVSIWLSKPLTFSKAISLLRKGKFNVVHEYSSSPILAFRTFLLGKFGGVKSVHTIITSNQGFWAKPFWGGLGRFVDKFIFTSSTYSKKYLNFLNKSKVEILPLGVNVDSYKKAKSNKKKYKLPKDLKVVLFLGPPEKTKGVFDLAETAARVLLRSKDVFFLFVFYRKMSNEIYESGVSKVKKILGKEPNYKIIESLIDVPEMLSSSDIVATPQVISHGTLVHPQTILEAMAAGKVVIAPESPEINELLEDGISGFTFDVSDKNGLEDSLSAALNSDEKVGSMAQKLVEKKFDLSENVKKLKKIYESL